MENVESVAKSAEMRADLNNIKELLLDIKDELRGLNQTYIPRTENMEMFRSRDEKINELKAEIKEVKEDQAKKRDRLPDWIAVGISIVALVLALFQIIQALNK